MDESNNGKEWLTAKEVARILGVDKSTVYRWCRSGGLPAKVSPGGHYRIRRADALGALRDVKVEPPVILPADRAAEAADYLRARGFVVG